MRRGRLYREILGTLICEGPVSGEGYWRRDVRREGGLLEL